MSKNLALEIAKVVGTMIVAGAIGYQATSTIEGTAAAIISALGGLFTPTPRKL